MLLEAPGQLDDKTVQLVQTLSDKVAAYAPGAAWVRTATLLEKTFGSLAPDAKSYVVDRLCTTLTEFGFKNEASQLHDSHGGI